MDNDFFNKLPQQGMGQFLKAGVLADNFHKLFRINRGFLCLCQFRLQFGGTALDLFLFGFIVCGKFRKAFIRNTPGHTVLIKPLEDSGQLRNPLFGCVQFLSLGSVAAFAAVDQQGIERFIQSYGALAAVVSFLLMILQAIAAPLPAFLITFANASLFGAFWGGLLSWTSSMAGAALCFFIARVMGREVVEKLTGKTVLDSMDGFFTRYGKHTILVCRLLPFVPFDPISYAAGLTSIRFRSFFIATGLGQLPATIVYSWAGSMLTGGTFWFVTGLFILFALTVVIFMAKKIWLERQKRNA